MNLTKSNYVTSQVAEKVLGVHSNTLRRWADTGKIDYVRPTIRGKRLYNVNQVLLSNSNDDSPSNKERKICYCRVSSKSQRDDLQRQVKFMEELHPGACIITDIGSGINFKRKGLQSIIKKAKEGEFNELIVAYRDRLCRFAFDLVEFMLKLHGVKLTVINSNKEESSENSELAEDLLSIIHIFNCKAMGKRRYSKTKNQGDNTGITNRKRAGTAN